MDTGTYYQSDQCTETSCNGDYSTLGAYNARSGSGSYVAGPPIPSQTVIQSVVLTPSFGGMGYGTLQNGLPFNQLTSSGYFTVNNAYPSYSNSCQSYTTALAYR